VPLTAQGEKPLATYAEMLASLKAEITASVPGIDEKKSAAFLAAVSAFAGANASEDAKPELVAGRGKRIDRHKSHFGGCGQVPG